MRKFTCLVGTCFFFGFFFFTTLKLSLTGKPFPKNYLSVAKTILKRLFRVFVHVYIHHFDKLLAIGAVSIMGSHGF